MVAFSNIVDMAWVNSSTLFALIGNKDPLKQSLFEFGIDIICSLVGQFIQQRNQAHLTPSIKQKVALPNTADVWNFHQRVKRGQGATFVLNSYKQILIRNPYLESNYFVIIG